MTFPEFEYLLPETVEEACQLLKENEGSAIIAGGTDMLIKLQGGCVVTKTVVGLKNINGLDAITFKKDGLYIGAMALLASVAVDKKIQKKFPSLAYAAKETATIQIRNMGTVVGNICNAVPSADNAPPLIVLGAEALVKSAGGERRIPIDKFFKGPGINVLNRDEIVAAIFVPNKAANTGDSYKHISQRSKIDIPAASVAVMLTMDKKVCVDMRVALGAVGPTPIRAVITEKMVIGQKVTKTLIEMASVQVSKEAKPITDVRSSAEYRKEMIAVLFKRAVDEALERINK